MRIAFLCKRRYMSKDVIDDRYARLYEFPFQLARRGHDVLGLCLSYYGGPPGEYEHEAAPGRLRWQARSLGRARLPGMLAYPGQALRDLRAFDPDVVIGASDLPHVVLGSWLARKLARPFVADLYDDFESFGLSRIPGARMAYRRAVRDADAVTCTSEALAAHVRGDYAARGEVVALPSTVDLTMFTPVERAQARAALGLPADAVLVGTAGGLHADKGIGTLYHAFEQLRERHPDMHLVLAGPTDGKLPVPGGPRVHHLGMLPHARIALLFNALDVGVIYLRDTRFGRFCFPQKAYEMAACELPFVAADIGAMHHLLASRPETRYRADDAADLARAIEARLADPRPADIKPRDWAALVGEMDGLLRRVAAAAARPSGAA